VTEKKQSQTTPPKQREKTMPRKKKPLEIKKTDELGGPKGLEPTRYGDWEKKGRCSDF
jgi:hypothetical protein